MVVTELLSIVSEKVTETFDVIETEVSSSEGELDETVGGVVSEDNYDGSGNPDGSAEYSTVSANATAGISIITYDGTGGGGNKWMGHGLGKKPDWQLFKVTAGRTGDWFDWRSDVDSSKYASNLNTANAATSWATAWNSTDPNTTLFVVGSADQTNEAGGKFLNYCFTSIKGFSKMAHFTGNGNANGPFVYTGFRPSWVVVKNMNNGSVRLQAIGEDNQLKLLKDWLQKGSPLSEVEKVEYE